ncbi:MAG: DNA methyltransferase, partial [Candidatus Sigynarchaeum springense]
MATPFDNIDALKSFLQSKGVTCIDDISEPEFKGLTAHVDAFGSTVHFIFHDTFSKKMKRYIPNLVRVSFEGTLYVYKENDETVYKKFNIASSRCLAQFLSNFTYEGERRSGHLSALYNLEDLRARYYVQYLEIAESLISRLASKLTTTRKQEIEEFVHVVLERIMFLAFLEKINGFPQEVLIFQPYLPGNYYELVLVPVMFWFREPHVIGTNLLVNGKDYGGMFKLLPFLNTSLFREVAFERVHVTPWIQYDATKGNLSVHLPAEIISNEDMTELFILAGKNGSASIPRFSLVAGENSTEEGINPEILGYIFEQGLDRNAFGAFYTPRGVTSRMVKTSLMNWLWQWLPADVQCKLVELSSTTSRRLQADYPPGADLQAACAEKLERAIYNQDEVPKDLADAVKRVVLEKIKNVKVIDTSCGSGAFLLAMFNELMALYMNCSPSIPSKKAMYDQAISIIVNNLFGVDILAEATEKAITRLWLAATEKCPDIKDLKPFQDLDFKIYKGNAIIGYANRPLAQHTLAVAPLVHDVHPPLMNNCTRNMMIDKDLREYNARFNDAIYQLVIAKRKAVFDSIKQSFIDSCQTGDNVAAKRILSKIRSNPAENIGHLLTPVEMDLVFERVKIPFKFSDPYGHLSPLEKKRMLGIKYKNHDVDPVILRCFEWMNPFHWASFFDANVFPAAKFDILIGNPPYEGARKESTRDAAMPIWNRLQRLFIIGLQEQGIYKRITGAWDLCMPFVERAFDLVNESGVISLLLPKSFGTTEYTNMLREHISNQHLMIQITKFDPKVSLFHRFDSATRRMVHVGIQNIIFTMRNRPIEDKRHAVIEYFTDDLDDRARDTPEIRTDYELQCHPFAKDKLDGIPLKFLCCIVKGMQVTTKADDARFRRAFTRDDIVSATRDAIHSMPLYSTRHVAPFNVVGNAWLEWGTDRVPARLHRKR